MNENQQRSMTMDKMEKYQPLQTNISKYLAQIFSVGPVAPPREFVLCENYVKTHYMAPKSFQPSAGNTGQLKR